MKNFNRLVEEAYMNMYKTSDNSKSNISVLNESREGRKVAVKFAKDLKQDAPSSYGDDGSILVCVRYGNEEIWVTQTSYSMMGNNGLESRSGSESGIYNIENYIEKWIKKNDLGIVEGIYVESYSAKNRPPDADKNNHYTWVNERDDDDYKKIKQLLL